MLGLDVLDGVSRGPICAERHIDWAGQRRLYGEIVVEQMIVQCRQADRLARLARREDEGAAARLVVDAGNRSAGHPRNS